MNNININSKEELKKFFNFYNFKFKKSLGQNFLINEYIASKIVEMSEIKKNEYVLEIGSGFGALSKFIIKKTKNLIVIEIDKEIVNIFKKNINYFDSNLIINDNILKINIKKIFQKKFIDFKPPIKIISNLPYYITTPIIINLLKDYNCFSSIIIMVQKELGERILNDSSDSNYGSLSVFCQYYSKPVKILDVKSESFYPKPKVDSIVLKMDIKKEKELNYKEEKQLFNVVRASFNKRRKTLLNSLSFLFNGDKEKTKYILQKANIDNIRRGETLSIEEFKKIAKIISN